MTILIQIIVDINFYTACPNIGVQYHQHGTSVGSVDNIDGWQSCGKECKNYDGCNYWTWWRNTGKCQFLSDRIPIKETINAVSGSKSCGTNGRNMLNVKDHGKLFKRSIGNTLTLLIISITDVIQI